MASLDWQDEMQKRHTRATVLDEPSMSPCSKTLKGTAGNGVYNEAYCDVEHCCLVLAAMRSHFSEKAAFLVTPYIHPQKSTMKCASYKRVQPPLALNSGDAGMQTMHN